MRPTIGKFCSKIFFVFLVTTTCTACYHMPVENEYSVIPLTNNRDFTREKGGDGLLPGVGY